MGRMKYETTEPAATHLVALVRAFDLSEGPVLELGTGYFSTLWLHHLATAFRWHVWSYESKVHWYNRALRYASEYHHIEFCNNWADAPIDIPWGMAFMDHSPAQRRHEDVARLADLAGYIVCHDSQPESDYEFLYSNVFPLFKYRYDFTKIKPWTVVLSNRFDLSSFA